MSGGRAKEEWSGFSCMGTCFFAYYESPDKRLYFMQACLQRNIDIWLAKLYEYVGRQARIRIQLVIAGVRSM